MKTVLVTAALVAFALVPPAAVAQPAPAAAIAAPAETPASQQARRLIEAAGQDDATFLRVIAEAYPNSDLSPEQWTDLRQRMRLWRIHGLAAATPTTADLWVFNGAMEDWMRVSVTVQPEPPHRITAFAPRFGGRPADAPVPAKLAPAEVAAAVRAKVAEKHAADLFDGAVLVAKDGRVLLAEAYGLADRQAKAPNTVQTQFRFGSMGKMFTAVAILQLVQQGKLDTTVPIGRYLPDYPNAEIASKVTIDHLLTHSGGTGDIFGPVRDAHRDTLLDTKDYVALFGARGPAFAPGARQEYSNYGFMLLGRIVETVSGLSYDDYLQRNIFAPAHMTDTGMQAESVRLPRRAVGYMRVKGQLTSAAPTLPLRGTPAGGGYSTVMDLERFGEALLANRLLDAAHTRRLTTGGMTLPDGRFFRYDFGGPLPDGRRFLGHNGGAPGMNGELRIIPDSGYTVVVLANRDPPAAQAIASWTTARLP